MATRKGTGTRSATTKSSVPARAVARTASDRTPNLANIVETNASKVATSDRTKARKPTSSNTNARILKIQDIRKDKQADPRFALEDGDREPIRAFLRIRPKLGDFSQSDMPYLRPLSSTTVQMIDPSGTNRIRLHPNAQVYTFNRVFPPETLQAEFFTSTALPLVRDLLSGQNGLLFTYGVTNSGKTYTIQGGNMPPTAGILPRTLDVIFNSLHGLDSDLPHRPIHLASVELNDDDNQQYAPLELADEKTLADILGEMTLQGADKTTIKVDKNYAYSVWISYAEVYNEKIYDLLSSDSAGSIQRNSGASAKSAEQKKRSTSAWSNLANLASSTSSTDVLLVKRKALPLKNDSDSNGKYISGLKCIRVRSAEEAKRVFRTGNINRRVFGTLANATSSRSHGIFTVRVIRVHRADHSDISVSRLHIIDLAGSERTKNTQNTGDRLKEAGSINKSLMVLGQCMEAMRSNQRRLAASLAAPGRGGLDPSGSQSGIKLAIVPFRHSKLTEIFQDFFVCEMDGRAVIIVAVNPFDTGFDENSHVMRFAALARDVTVTTASSPHKAAVKQSTSRLSEKKMPQTPHRRTVTIPTGAISNRKASEAHLEIVEEDEDADEDYDDEPTDLLVDALFEELEDLRVRLYESEMRCAIIEVETREEVMREMEARIRDMQTNFAKRLMDTVERNEAKVDAKIDMLHQFGVFGNKSQPRRQYSIKKSGFASVESPHSLDADTSQETGDGKDQDDSFDSSFANRDGGASDQDSIRTPLQRRILLSGKEKTKLNFGPPVIGLREEDMIIDEMDAEETETIGEEDAVTEEEGDEEDISEQDDDDFIDDEAEEDSEADSTDDSEDNDKEGEQVQLRTAEKPKPKESSKAPLSGSKKPESSVFSTLQKKMDVLNLFEDDLKDHISIASQSMTDEVNILEINNKSKGKKKTSACKADFAPVRRSTRLGKNR